MKTEEYTKPMSRFTEKFHDVQERVGETAKNWTHATDEFVHENPWKTISMVAVAALVVGFLLGMRRD